MSDLTFALLPWQQTVYLDSTRFKVIAAGRRCGKSRLAATILLIEALRCPAGSAVLYVSPTMGQSRQIIWDLLLELGREVIQSSHVNNLDITMINGARIYVRGADRPDTLRGVSLTYAVLDEVADIKPAAWEQVIRASLSDKKGAAMFIGTPKGRNWFFDLWNLGQDEQDSDWKSWHFTTADNPLIDPTEIESAKKTLSSFSFKQEYMASFSNAGSDIFKEEWLKYGEAPEHGSYFVAVDLAGFEEVAKQAANVKKRLDESAIAVVKVTEDGQWFVEEIEHGRWDIRETSAKILMKMRDYQPISVGIERGALKNAVLPYLSDLMRKNNVYSHIIDLTHGNRKKADRIIWSLQGRFEHGRIVLNNKKDWSDFVDQIIMFPAQGVHDDLCFVAGTMISTPNGLMQIEHLRVNDLVDTPDGPRRVLAQRMTNAAAEVLSLNGQLIGTKNHPIMTNRGWIDLQNIRKDDILVHQHTGVSSWVFRAKLAWSRSLFTLTATSTTGIQKLISWLTGGTLPRLAAAYCTGMFGSFTTGLFPQSITSTTKTEIGRTTTFPTWNVSPSLHMGMNILNSAAQTPNGLRAWRTWRPSGLVPQLGTHLQKVWLGTKKTLTQLGKTENQLSTHANSAASSFNRSKRQRCISAVANALQQIGEKSTQTITPLKQRQSVYNLTVEHAHSYYANGILVHNCDALSYIDQLAVTSYFEEENEDYVWKPMDIIAGI
jgi:hypothetical protein